MRTGEGIDRTITFMIGYNGKKLDWNCFTAYFKDYKEDEYWKLSLASQCSKTEKGFIAFHKRLKEEKKADRILNSLYNKMKYR